MARQVTIPSEVITEEIHSFNYTLGQGVSVIIGEGVEDVNGEFSFNIKPNYKTVLIENSYYQALISPNPSWSPAKPENTFRKDDLWLVIDAIRAGSVLDIGV